MIEAALTLTAPELATPDLSLISLIGVSAPGSPDFSAILTEMVGAPEEKAVEGKQSDKSKLDQAGDVSFGFNPLAPFAAAGIKTMAENESIAAEPASAKQVAIDETHWAEVRRFEYTVRYEPKSEAQAGDEAEAEPQAETAGESQPEPKPAAPRTARPEPLVTTDPIANLQQQQIPDLPHVQQRAHRALTIDKSGIETRTAERGKDSPMPAGTDANTPSDGVFADMTAQATVESESALPAHHVEIPVMPSLQVVRTLAMEVGDAGSEIIIRLEERSGDVHLKFDSASETMRQSLESSIDTLVDDFIQEAVPVSRIELGDKALITKISRMKGAR